MLNNDWGRIDLRCDWRWSSADALPPQRQTWAALRPATAVRQDALRELPHQAAYCRPVGATEQWFAVVYGLMSRTPEPRRDDHPGGDRYPVDRHDD